MTQYVARGHCQAILTYKRKSTYNCSNISIIRATIEYAKKAFQMERTLRLAKKKKIRFIISINTIEKMLP